MIRLNRFYLFAALLISIVQVSIADENVPADMGRYTPSSLIEQILPTFESAIYSGTVANFDTVTNWSSEMMPGDHSLVWSGSEWSVSTDLTPPVFHFVSDSDSEGTRLEVIYQKVNQIRRLNLDDYVVGKDFMLTSRKTGYFGISKIKEDDVVVVGIPRYVESSFHSVLLCPRKITRGPRGAELIESDYKLRGMKVQFKADAKASLKTIGAVGSGAASILVSEELPISRQFKSSVTTDSPRVDLEYFPRRSESTNPNQLYMKGSIFASAEIVAPNGLRQVQSSEAIIDSIDYTLKTPITFPSGDAFYKISGGGCYLVGYGVRAKKNFSQVQPPKLD